MNLANPSVPRLSQIVRILLLALLSIFFVNKFGVFHPKMPAGGLDASWSYGLNQAVSQGLTFGRDIIFTFGPYASVYTREFHPATVGLMILGTILLDVLYICSFVWLLRNAKWQWEFVVLCSLLVLTLTEDAFLLSIPLLVSTLLVRLHDRGRIEAFHKKKTQIAILLAFACLGILPLIKGTLILETAGTCLFSAIFLIVIRQRALACVCLISTALSTVVLWMIAGQRLSALPGFFETIRFVISGYSEAMALSGPSWELLAVMLGAALILQSIATQKQLLTIQRIFLLLTYSLFLFVGFKAGFVRQIDERSAITANCLAFGSLLLLLFCTESRLFAPRRLLAVAIAATAIGSGLTWTNNFVGEIRSVESPSRRHKELPILGILAHLRTDLGTGKVISMIASSQPFRILPWDFSFSLWNRQFEMARRRIREDSNLNFVMTGTVDVYPLGISNLLAMDYHWNPRPIFQSYSAYTPELIRLNEAHLRSPVAPDQLILHIDSPTTDHHPPSLDDGASWPAMLDNYVVADTTSTWIHLQRKSLTDLKSASQFNSDQLSQARLGEEIVVPPFSGPVFVSIYERPSPLGALRGFLFRLPPLLMRITKKNGETLEFRVNANMMETGFFLSPLVMSNEDFLNLYRHRDAVDENDKVRKLSVVVTDDKNLYWNDEFAISFRQYKFSDSD